MSFGGAVSVMITSIKNNTRLRRKSYFDKNILIKDKERDALLDKKATPEQLESIRNRLIEENRQKRIMNFKIFLFSLLLTITAILLLLYIW